MKKISNKIIIIVIIITAITLNIPSRHSNHPKHHDLKPRPLPSGSITLTSLTINDSKVGENWDWARTQPWCSGSGTEIDPFIISDVIFQSESNLNPCLRIYNSSKPFQISGCQFIGFNEDSNRTVTALELLDVRNAVISKSHFQNTIVSVIVSYGGNNTFNNNYFNKGFGIFFIKSNGNRFTANNADNADGISLTESSYNWIQDNTLDCLRPISLDKSHHNHVLNNTIKAVYEGIEMKNSSNNVIEGNSINGNPAISLVDCAKTTIRFNNFKGSPNCVIQKNCGGTILEGNNCPLNFFNIDFSILIWVGIMVVIVIPIILFHDSILFFFKRILTQIRNVKKYSEKLKEDRLNYIYLLFPISYTLMVTFSFFHFTPLVITAFTFSLFSVVFILYKLILKAKQVMPTISNYDLNDEREVKNLNYLNIILFWNSIIVILSLLSIFFFIIQSISNLIFLLGIFYLLSGLYYLLIFYPSLFRLYVKVDHNTHRNCFDTVYVQSKMSSYENKRFLKIILFNIFLIITQGFIVIFLVLFSYYQYEINLELLLLVISGLIISLLIFLYHNILKLIRIFQATKKFRKGFNRIEYDRFKNICKMKIRDYTYFSSLILSVMLLLFSDFNLTLASIIVLVNGFTRFIIEFVIESLFLVMPLLLFFVVMFLLIMIFLSGLLRNKEYDGRSITRKHKKILLKTEAFLQGLSDHHQLEYINEATDAENKLFGYTLENSRLVYFKLDLETLINNLPIIPKYSAFKREELLNHAKKIGDSIPITCRKDLKLKLKKDFPSQPRRPQKTMSFYFTSKKVKKRTSPLLNLPEPKEIKRCVNCQKKKGKYRCDWCHYNLCHECGVSMNLGVEAFIFCPRCEKLLRDENVIKKGDSE